ncbi:hypothetical protein EI94DRAFT_1620309, partial [Lactarius quietus]
LPPGATVHNRLHQVFIPTYERWVGTLENPWFIPDNVAVKTMQSIWDVIYPTLEWTVTVNDHVFKHVVQCLCKWCTSFRSAANAMLIQFFICSANKVVFKLLSFHKTWAEQMLFEYNFVYEAVEEDKQSGLMHAPFILQVFAVHLNRIVGAVDVPGLEVAGSDEDTSIIAKYLPIGALALAVAAVERTLQHCANGEMRIHGDEAVDKWPNKPTIKAKAKLNPQTRNISSVKSHFSADIWGSAMKNYVKSILKMEDGSLEITESLAKEFMSQSKIHRELSTCKSEVHAFTEDDDPHACLV